MPRRGFNRKAGSWGYGHESRQVEPGEVFDLEGMRNDELLLRHGYVEQWVGNTKQIEALPQCDGCAKTFVSESHLLMHYNGRIHPESPNYAGPQARTEGEKPTPREAELLVGTGNAPRY